MVFFWIIVAFHICISETGSQFVVPGYQPTLMVTPRVVSLWEEVQMSCGTWTPFIMECYFLADGVLPFGPFPHCRVSVTGEQLLGGRESLAVNTVLLTCYYYWIGVPPAYSNSVTVLVKGDVPKPSVTVRPAVVTRHDLVILTCNLPQPYSDVECTFNEQSRSTPVATKCPSVGEQFCEVQLLGQQITGDRLSSLFKETVVSCAYNVQDSRLTLPSPRSDSKKVHVWGDVPQPTVTVRPAVVTRQDLLTLTSDNVPKPTVKVTPTAINPITLSASTEVQPRRPLPQSFLWRYIVSGLLCLAIVGLLLQRLKRQRKTFWCEEDVYRAQHTMRVIEVMSPSAEISTV